MTTNEILDAINALEKPVALKLIRSLVGSYMQTNEHLKANGLAHGLITALDAAGVGVLLVDRMGVRYHDSWDGDAGPAVNAIMQCVHDAVTAALTGALGNPALMMAKPELVS